MEMRKLRDCSREKLLPKEGQALNTRSIKNPAVGRTPPELSHANR